MLLGLDDIREVEVHIGQFTLSAFGAQDRVTVVLQRLINETFMSKPFGVTMSRIRQVTEKDYDALIN
jgi:hypothetical protein